MQKVQLLEKLIRMRIEPEGAAMTFAARLSSENGWSRDYAERVLSEYRRFLFLAVTAGHPVTPSDEIDQAWHLHLTYTQHYWEILCGQIFERPLHHGPTLGGAQEDNRYLEQYDRTIAAYTREFGHAPPVDLWPAAKQRFGRHYRRVAVGQHWMVPKKAGYAVIPLVTLAACTPVEWAAGGIVAGLGLVFGTVAIAAAAGAGPTKKKSSGSSGCGGAATVCVSGNCGGGSSGDCDGGSGGCGGGCGS
jgi:hypothetical protein